MTQGETGEPRRHQVAAARALLVLGFLALWQFVVSAHWVDAFWVSSPLLVLEELWTLIRSGELLAHVSMTVLEALIAFAISSVLGIASGLMLARSPFWDEVFAPIIVVFNSCRALPWRRSSSSGSGSASPRRW